MSIPFTGKFGVALFFEDFEAAAAYYAEVLGPADFTVGTGTQAWRIGTGWLTVLRGKSGTPTNVEVILEVETPADADRLQRAFRDAGGEGPEPSDEVMDVPVRYCPVQDPFGTSLLILSPR